MILLIRSKTKNTGKHCSGAKFEKRALEHQAVIEQKCNQARRRLYRKVLRFLKPFQISGYFTWNDVLHEGNYAPELFGKDSPI
ncbi:hypothetical protein MKW98_008446 [Papaver atlanticum]|uniref:Uncharacterized protein n=1 Tax=Papaver atlanticum TaxID=357466 RepID=A0AAD4SHC0_9MAGN|nr:hypothetical protein MKW98_008446 [Papaver atlanticum]